MGKLRKGIVSVVVTILTLYFLLCMIGLMPYDYDLIKKSVAENQELLDTGFLVHTDDWRMSTGIPSGEGDFMDSIVYKGDMYVVTTDYYHFSVWEVTKTGTWVQKHDGEIYAHINIDRAEFIEYSDSDGQTTLYVFLSSGAYVTNTDVYGSYDGDLWETSSDNPKFLPYVSLKTDSIAVNGDILYVGVHQDTGSGRICRIYKWNAHTWTGWTKVFETAETTISAMVTFTAPMPETYDTVYFAVKGGGTLYPYAGIYYLDLTETKQGAMGFQSQHEIEIKDMSVYKESIFIGTDRASIYNYSRYPLRTTPPSGTLYEYSSSSDPLHQIECFGIYNDYLYAGITQNGNDGQIHKMTSRTYNMDSWVKSYLTGEGTVTSFCVFEGKFYATTASEGNMFVLNEIISYTNPSIQHTPVTEGYFNLPTKITAKVFDYDGIDDVLLAYEVEGRGLKVKTMNLNSGTGETRDGKTVNGTYSAEIPIYNERVNVTYYITAKDKDSNVTMTETYTFKIFREKTLRFFGIDYRVLYFLAILITLGIGYWAYGDDRKKIGRWNSNLP